MGGPFPLREPSSYDSLETRIKRIEKMDAFKKIPNMYTIECKINAKCRQNYFPIKEINAIYSKKQNCSDNRSKFILTLCVKFRNANNVGVKQRNVGTSQCPLYRRISTQIRQCFFLSGVYREFGAKIMEIKVAEINVNKN